MQVEPAMTSNRLESLEAKFTPTVVECLEQQGYAIIEDGLPNDWAETLLQDCRLMQREGNVKQHFFQFGQHRIPKPNIFELVSISTFYILYF